MIGVSTAGCCSNSNSLLILKRDLKEDKELALSEFICNFSVTKMPL